MSVLTLHFNEQRGRVFGRVFGIWHGRGRGVRMRASNPLCVGEQPMVALNEQFHHNGAPLRLRVTGYGVQRGGQSADLCILHRSRITDQKRRTSNDLFIDHYSLVIERRAGANETIYCGYPDNNRVSTDIGTGLNNPDTELCYVRNRTYNSIPGTALRQEPKSRQATGVATRVLQRDPVGYAGGVNVYEYVGGRAVAAVDPEGLGTCDDLMGKIAECQWAIAANLAAAIAQVLGVAQLAGCIRVYSFVAHHDANFYVGSHGVEVSRWAGQTEHFSAPASVGVEASELACREWGPATSRLARQPPGGKVEMGTL